jgi:hypothetical protein
MIFGLTADLTWPSRQSFQPAPISLAGRGKKRKEKREEEKKSWNEERH